MSYEMKPSLGDWFTASTAGIATAGTITALCSPLVQDAGMRLSAIFYQHTPLAADPSRLIGLLIPQLAVSALVWLTSTKVVGSVLKASALDGGRVTIDESAPPPPMVS